ncbi:His-Xaa-Ser system radical SAM maturase HxsB [Candidatus Woesearchaeota archaeon]|nr:His-Xaa-Ser system radical SAM maturase HxsB [Candidatus Woesearchaeota archaeon]
MQVTDIKGLLPYNVLPIKHKYLLTTRYGSWVLLDADEYAHVQRRTVDVASPLYMTLARAGLVATDENLKEIVRNYRSINANMLNGPSLHIISVTSRCNFNCSYCHTSAPIAKGVDMTRETAIKVLENVFRTPSKAVTIEFQGGECLLNWPIVQFIIENARKLNELEKKDLRITAVTNLSLMTDDKIQFLMDNQVSICTSLDGPAVVHDRNRPLRGEQATHHLVTKWIRAIQHEGTLRSRTHPIGALPTITKQSLPYPKEIVDEYVAHHLPEIHLRPLNYLGIAVTRWKEIGYTAEEFISFWQAAADYILELNKKGVPIKERLLATMLTKILKKQDPFYTELMSPCGAGRTQIAYEYDGSVYTCDEGRMLGEDLFKLGHVMKDQYTDMMASDTLLSTIAASILDNYTCKTCAYLPWCGTCPVLNVSEQGNILPKMKESMRHKIYFAQFSWLFEKIVSDPKALPIFMGWVSLPQLPHPTEPKSCHK